MIAIKDMNEMPESCFKCPLKTVETDINVDTYYYCGIIDKIISGKKRFKNRDKDCRLIEIDVPDKTE